MSSQKLSLMSMNVSDATASCTRAVAMYKGLKVAVYTVDKTEISLSLSDLIELINVCILFIDIIYLFIYLSIIKSYTRYM